MWTKAQRYSALTDPASGKVLIALCWRRLSRILPSGRFRLPVLLRCPALTGPSSGEVSIAGDPPHLSRRLVHPLRIGCTPACLCPHCLVIVCAPAGRRFPRASCRETDPCVPTLSVFHTCCHRAVCEEALSSRCRRGGFPRVPFVSKICCVSVWLAVC